MAYDFSKKNNIPAQFNANNNFANVNNETNTENSNSTDKNSDKKNGITQEQKDAERAKAAAESELDPLVKKSADFIVNKQQSLNVSIFSNRHKSICKKVYDAAVARAGTSSPTENGLKWDVSALNHEKNVIDAAISDFKALIIDENKAENEAEKRAQNNQSINNTNSQYSTSGNNNWKSMNSSVFQRNRRNIT